MAHTLAGFVGVRDVLRLGNMHSSNLRVLGALVLAVIAIHRHLCDYLEGLVTMALHNGVSSSDATDSGAHN